MLKSFQKKIFGENLYSLITDQKYYKNRRILLKSGLTTLAFANPPLVLSKETNLKKSKKGTLDRIEFEKSQHNLKPITKYTDVTSYNNFYEFGTGKSDPSKFAPKFLKVDPWSIEITGLVLKAKTINYEQLYKISSMEERVYRLRCVEGWSMIVPWIGYSLKKVLETVQPLGSAKFIEFTTLADPSQMPAVGGFNPVLNWPYREALRIDEAYNPLTLMTFGLYGKKLPEQNGAPVRVIVPWKYGFKSAKSIVRIKFVEKMPLTSWVESAPGEYGFYSNVNPNVPHRRWSQQTERRIGEGGIFSKRHKTLMFNGYADEVSSMYTGMDLKKFY
jgi:sulfoxide reductase catalytic subunit YedY